MKKIYNEHQELVGLEASDAPTVRFWREVHLKRAQPISSVKNLLQAEVFVGADVRNREDEHLGVIRDIIMDTATHDIQYLLVANGGFLGFGQNLLVARCRDARA